MATLGKACVVRGKLKSTKTKAKRGGTIKAGKANKDKEWTHITFSPNPDIFKQIAS